MVETDVMISSSAFRVYERIKEEVYNMELLCTNKDLYPVIAQSLSSLISARNDPSRPEGGTCTTVPLCHCTLQERKEVRVSTVQTNSAYTQPVAGLCAQ